MTINKLTHQEKTQCYRNARKQLTPIDRENLDYQSELLAENLPKDAEGKKITEYARLEILAKLGIWLIEQEKVKGNNAN